MIMEWVKFVFAESHNSGVISMYVLVLSWEHGTEGWMMLLREAVERVVMCGFPVLVLARYHLPMGLCTGGVSHWMLCREEDVCDGW